MKIQIDATKCSGYGACTDHCPSLLEVDEWGYALVLGDGVVPEAIQADARAAVADCPEHAISLGD